MLFRSIYIHIYIYMCVSGDPPRRLFFAGKAVSPSLRERESLSTSQRSLVFCVLCACRRYGTFRCCLLWEILID